MVLQVSDVPLTEDVVKKGPREFFPTISEWVTDGNAEQITVLKAVAAGLEAMYTVPEGFKLFITSATQTLRCTSGAPSSRAGNITVGASVANPDLKFILITAIVGGNTASVTSNSFPMPITASSKQIIFHSSVANSTAQSVFHGFLLPNKVAIR